MTQTLIILTILLSFILPTTAQQQLDKYLLLATNRTGTMEKELNEAGERGYRFADTQGGATSFGGNEAVVMQREMNAAPPEYDFVGMTVFSSTFGGDEVAVILEAEITDPQQ